MGWNGERTEDVFRRCGTCEVLGEKLRNGDSIRKLVFVEVDKSFISSLELSIFC